MTKATREERTSFIIQLRGHAKMLLTALVFRFRQTASLYNLILHSKGWHYPLWIRPFNTSYASRKCPIDIFTKQYYRCYSLIEVYYSQPTLTFVMLTRSNKQNSPPVKGTWRCCTLNVNILYLFVHKDLHFYHNWKYIPNIKLPQSKK